MQRITKKITLEQFKSRLPLSYPAINDGKITFVNKDNLKVNINGNYNAIPLSLSENICGQFSTFTSRMGEEYGGSVLPYNTIKKWYTEFLQYYELIYHNQCNIPFSSATDYFVSIYGSDVNGYDAYSQMDENHTMHGGDKFYRWLIDNYFIILDFRNEYFKALDDGVDVSMSYPEWMGCLEELSTYIMSFPDVIEFYGELTDLYVAKLNHTLNCCDVNKYEAMGGDSMYRLVDNWVNKTNDRIEKINKLVEYYKEELIPSATISININKKVEDLGNFISFSKEYVPGKSYNRMNVCTYNNDVYILMSGDGNTEDPKTGRPTFDTNGWKKYSEYYRATHPEEFYEYEPLFEISGRTVSSLDAFERTIDTIDMLGHSMPGYYKASKLSKFMQPAEGTMLDIRLEIGKVINDSKLENEQYVGDVLWCANIFFKDLDGNIILSSVQTCYEGDSFLSKVENCIASMDNYEEIYENRIYVDFVYYKGCKFQYDKNKIKLLDEPNGSKVGIRCVDHCYLMEESVAYYLSSNVCYPIRYYEIYKDIEEHYSEEYNKQIKVVMCDWYLQPAAYDLNDVVISPGFRREETIGFSSPESTNENIYIDRGYATVLDKHLKICEVASYESLEKYGNGSFHLINLEEERV